MELGAAIIPPLHRPETCACLNGDASAYMNLGFGVLEGAFSAFQYMGFSSNRHRQFQHRETPKPGLGAGVRGCGLPGLQP